MLVWCCFVQLIYDSDINRSFFLVLNYSEQPLMIILGVVRRRLMCRFDIVDLDLGEVQVIN